jgi:hypothetical protein
MMAAMEEEEEATEEAVEAMAEAEEEEEASVAAGVEAVVEAAAMEDRAGKDCSLTFGLLLCGFSKASRRLKLSKDHPSMVQHQILGRSAFDSSAIYPIIKGTRIDSFKTTCLLPSAMLITSRSTAFIRHNATCALQDHCSRSRTHLPPRHPFHTLPHPPSTELTPVNKINAP